MTRDNVFRILHSHLPTIHKFGVRSIAIFGSVARNEARPDSDLDILVDFGGPATFDQYMDLKTFLEDTLQKPIDLVTVKAIKPRLRSAIEHELLYVA